MQKNKVIRAIALAIWLASAISCANTVNPNSDDTTDTATDTPADTSPARSLLAAYNIKEVPAKSVTDPQPFGTKVAATVARKQIYYDGMTRGADANPQLLDYAGGTLTSVYTGTKAEWAANPHVSIPARLGSDGKESIVSVVFAPKEKAYIVGENKGTVSLQVWDGSGTVSYTPITDEFSLYLMGWGGNWYYQMNNELSAAAGDLTGDGKDEIGFCVGNRFVIVSGDLKTVLYKGWATGTKAVDIDTTTLHPSRVAAGDIKGDGSIAFITTYGSTKANGVGSYAIYAGSQPDVIATGSLAGGTCPLSLMYANVALGDLDGDGQKDVIFAGRQDLTANACNVVVAKWSSTSSNLSFWSSGNTIAVTGSDWAFHPIPALVAFNPDPKTGDADARPDTLLAWNTVFRYDSTTQKLATGYKGLSAISLPVYTNACAGDVNYDNQDELISLSSAAGVGFEVYSLGSGNSFTRTAIPATVGTYMSLCAADLTGQSVVFEYLGTSVKYTNPQVIGVLASCPYYESAASNPAFGNASTDLTMTKTTSTDKTSSFTLETSFSVGASADCPLWGKAGEMEVRYTLGASFGFGFSESMEYSCSDTYSTLAGKDAVIYSCIPFDVYEYRVVNSPNAEAIGTTVTVNIPRTAQIVLMDRDTYNALPNNPAKVGSSVLSHTAGKPHSYKGFADINALCAASGGLIDTVGDTSPVGASTVRASTVSVSKGSGTILGGGISISASVEEVVLGCLFGAEIGFSSEFEYTVTTSDSTEISGSVPGINAEDSPFTFGIAGYKLQDATVQSTPFMVVNYWVE